MKEYATKEELKEEIEEVKSELKNIEENHLTSIWCAIEFLRSEVRNLRWFILGSVAVLAIVLAILDRASL